MGRPSKQHSPSPFTSGHSLKRSYVDEDEISVDHLERRVEIGIIRPMLPMRLQLVFEGFPVWMFIIETSNCYNMCLPQFADFDSVFAHVAAAGFDVSLVKTFCGDRASQFSFGVPAQAPNLILVSGSMSFLADVFKNVDSAMIGVLDYHFSGRLRNGRPSGSHLQGWTGVTWHRVKHSSVGGATNYISLFVSFNLDVQPSVTILRRTIGKYYQAKTRPKMLQTPFNFPGAHYTLESRLDPSCLQRTVIAPTTFYCTGWGHRPLTLEELGEMFDFPRFVTVDQLDLRLFTLPPIQLLMALFTSAWSAVLEPGLLRVPVPVTPRPLNIVPPVTGSCWIPELQRFLSHTWTVSEDVRDKEAAKRDDAAIPVYLWDNRVKLLFGSRSAVIPFLRKRMLSWYRRRLVRELCHHLRSVFGSDWLKLLLLSRQATRAGGNRGGRVVFFQSIDQQESLEELSDPHIQQLRSQANAGVDIIRKASNCSWFGWDAGSTLIFWRWNLEYQQIALEGMLPHISGELPKYLKRPRRTADADKFELIAQKLETIIARNYIGPGFVSSLIDFFDVPKGEDIRLVYNGSSCGLNAAIWAPKFWLPFPKAAVRVLDFGYYSADIDLGEMFLNFPVHRLLQEYSGIDLSAFRTRLKIGKGTSAWYRWTRNWMGAKSSPYSSVRFYHLAEEFCRGNRLERENPLRWDTVVLNLPGAPTFNPSLPRVMKWDIINKCIAGDIISYVDDGRASGRSVETTWKITRQVTSRCQHLGIQDATKKRTPPTQKPGAWAGAVIGTTATTVLTTVTQEKWERARDIVGSIWDQLHSQEAWNLVELDYKELEKARGFLGHISMTFEMIVPFLKGFHLTLALYNGQRDDEGWKMSDKAWLVYLGFNELEDLDEDADEMESDDIQGGAIRAPPTKVRALPLLKDNLYALRELFSLTSPPDIQARNTQVQVVRYGFGDASGAGFGSTMSTAEGLKYRIGVWGKDDEAESSNFKEFENVVSAIEHSARAGELKDAVLFFFTDNSTVEAVLYKGNSKSRKLFFLMVRFRKLELEFGLHITVVHVSGKRMIAQGTDGVSRGTMREGVAAGMDMMSFIPLHVSALARCEKLEPWIKSWAQTSVETLSPKGWFTRGHDHAGGTTEGSIYWRIETQPGTYLWSPPPAAADVAIEELRKALIKRQDSTHIFVCPRLLTTEWRRQLAKAADLMITIEAGQQEWWPADMYEPLTLAFVFPFLPFNPWKRRGTPKMRFMESKMSKMFQGEGMDAGNILREFFAQQRALAGMPEHVVRRMLYFM